jgi:hypothetical protein
MTIYNITLYSDMGHLVMSPCENHIRNFVYEKTSNYILPAIDTSGLGCRFYILKPNLKTVWEYKCGLDTVIITYNLDIYDEIIMNFIN